MVPQSASRSYYIQTFGCQMNVRDSEQLAAQFEADGLVPAERLEEADVVAYNTCCIRENADGRLYGHLGHAASLKASSPGKRVVVAGCLAQKDRDAVMRRAPWVDVVVGTHNLASATDLLRRREIEGPVVEVLDPSASPSVALLRPPVRGSRGPSAYVTIQTGCDNCCAFCIVPSVRGPEISRPIDDILGEVRSLVAAGTLEVTLLGQNVNSYGRDITRRRPLFADLLRAVGAVEGIGRVRFTSPHPKDLRPEVVAAMAETPAVCEQLHLPLQSGSDRVLAAMHRGYTAKRYLARLAMARDAVPDLAVTTDIIVGFPGETEQDFERTLQVVAEAGYDSAYTFEFSPRPGTEAGAMTRSFIPPEVVAERFDRLVAVVERSALERHRARVGLVEEVMVEGPSKKDSSRITGRTRQGKLVHFPPGQSPRGDGSLHECQPGTLLRVRITGASPHHLLGELFTQAS